MEIKAKDFYIDEERSTRLIVAVKHPACPLNEHCFNVAPAIGGAFGFCIYLEHVDSTTGKCNCDKKEQH